MDEGIQKCKNICMPLPSCGELQDSCFISLGMSQKAIVLDVAKEFFWNRKLSIISLWGWNSKRATLVCKYSSACSADLSEVPNSGEESRMNFLREVTEVEWGIYYNGFRLTVSGSSGMRQCIEVGLLVECGIPKRRALFSWRHLFVLFLPSIARLNGTVTNRIFIMVRWLPHCPV